MSAQYAEKFQYLSAGIFLRTPLDILCLKSHPVSPSGFCKTQKYQRDFQFKQSSLGFQINMSRYGNPHGGGKYLNIFSRRRIFIIHPNTIFHFVVTYFSPKFIHHDGIISSSRYIKTNIIVTSIFYLYIPI